MFNSDVTVLFLSQASSCNVEKKMVFPATDYRLSYVVAIKSASSLDSALNCVAFSGQSFLLDLKHVKPPCKTTKKKREKQC